MAAAHFRAHGDAPDNEKAVAWQTGRVEAVGGFGEEGGVPLDRPLAAATGTPHPA